ncbi:C6 sexual development transcription factor NosA [Talaromyces proteolyticus]|uniref:C6 sexual development transcription factor NosA n=1 Tax=Talaromyces proteolyticus TaxID=1131652 RepID=A0AAD4KSU9_9EURO|nr:C6 sexual development transcription factor NosA [Talaromyces proteolyticus]KAH8700288.1 C6 sexual development transcription factor NosA [Talaromyces proteolyticus]
MPTTKNPEATIKRRRAQKRNPLANDESGRMHTRSRSGCYTCRLRRKKCDEAHPSCRACINLCVKCEYSRPQWWANAEQRKVQKERIKNKIKQTKLDEKNNAVAGRRNRPMPLPLNSPYAPEYNFNRPFYPETYDPFASHLPTPALGPAPYGQFPPYEVDVRTERQLFVNDVQTRVDTSFSTFNTFAPPQLHATLPHFPENEWIPQAPPSQAAQFTGEAGPSFVPSNAQSFSVMQMNIEVDDCDRPLLNHFVDNVLRLIFPIVEAHQGGHERAQAILHSLESNKSYLHCCLSVAAIHLKSTIGIEGEAIDSDILRHRFEAVSQLCAALNQDTEHDKILEATLAMIFFHCSVGEPDDYLPDIAWNDHFHAAISLINKLDLPNALLQCTTPFEQPPFNMTLASWIDILGATMLGKSPQFAHAYRTKHLSGTPSGLRELMGCDDRVMYLISEIACLDALRSEGLVDDMAVCSHVSALGQQLEFTEHPNPTLENPYNNINGAIRPDQLTKNITTVFRIAARIYLCSLVPGFDRHQASNINLVEAVTHALQFIPSGPNGYDRSLVWPLLITGVYSDPSSSFRQILNERIVAMGDYSDFGSFGRVYRLLQEVWRLNDDPITPVSIGHSNNPQMKQDNFSSPPLGTPPMREIKKNNVHWRDVMRRNGWKYLLI